MAKFYASAKFDIRQFSLEPIFSGWAANSPSIGMQNASTLHSVAYADYVRISADVTATVSEDDQLELLLFSTANLAMREFPENPFTDADTPAITGTAHGLSLKFYAGTKGESGVENLGLTGVTIDTLALLAAVESASTSDDRAMITAELGGNDSFVLSGSADYMTAGAGNDTMTGNAGNDSLLGEAGVDKLFGNSGADLIYGGSSGDFIYGGTSADRMYGGSSGDDFVFNDGETGKGSARDIIYDFAKGSDDLDLRLIDANTKKSGDQKFTYESKTADNNGVWYKVYSGKVIVYGDNTGDGKADFEIELRGVSSLSSGDFLL